MSVTFDPNTALTIVNSTDATPIVIETSANHNLATGDSLAIFAHLVNTNANGEWPTVTVVDANHLSLDGSVGTGAGAGAATGVVIPFTALGVELPANGDDYDADALGGGLEAILDRIAFTRRLTVLSSTVYTGNATDTVPDGARLTIVEGWGAGGSGGGGAGGNTNSVTEGSSGGAGGGSAKKVIKIGSFPPRSAQAVVIGASVAGGAAGATDANGSDGNPGNDSTYGGVWTFPGGGPGSQGQTGFTLSSTYALSLPGTSSKNVPTAISTDANADLAAFALSRHPGEGGYTLESANPFATSSDGCDSDGFLGGAAGAHGSFSTANGGSGGGGGAAGPGGAGGIGGAGGNGAHFGGGVPASPGTPPAANSGAGGGGGGGGGSSGSAAFGGAGSAGTVSGSGKMRVTHLGAPK